MISDFTIPLGPRSGFSVDAVEHKGNLVIIRTSGLKHPDGVFQFVDPHGMVPDGTFTDREFVNPVSGVKETRSVQNTKYDPAAFLESELARAVKPFGGG